MVVLTVETKTNTYDNFSLTSISGINWLKDDMHPSEYIELKKKLGFEGQVDLPKSGLWISFNDTMTGTDLLNILTKFKFRIVTQGGAGAGEEAGRDGYDYRHTWTLQRN